MQAMSGGPTTPIEQITALDQSILDKLIAAGITTIEELADMTPEQLEDVPGIGEKTVEKISNAVRGYFEEGAKAEGDASAEGPAETLDAKADDTHTGETATIEDNPQEDAMQKSSFDETPEEILADQAALAGGVEEADEVSVDDLAAQEDRDSDSDAYTDADARAEAIELDNDTMDTLVAESQEISDETIDTDGHDRG